MRRDLPRRVVVWSTLLLLLVTGVQIVESADSYERLVVDQTTGGVRFTAALVDPPGQDQMRSALCRVGTLPVQITYDGTVPTSGVGMRVEPGEVLWVPGHERLQKFRATPASTGPGVATMTCAYSSDVPVTTQVQVLGTREALPPTQTSRAFPVPVCNPVTRPFGNCR